MLQIENLESQLFTRIILITFCGECSFPSDTENNHNVQFLFSCYILSVPVNSLQLQLNLKSAKMKQTLFTYHFTMNALDGLKRDP